MLSNNETAAFLDSLQKTGIKPGLTRIKHLMARLGEPQHSFKSVLITGTNGKGSTAAFIHAMLRCAGLKVGLFTSPHLIDVRERIVIDGQMISHELFNQCAMEVKAAMTTGERPIRITFFEALTAIGFLAFSKVGLDLAVVEVGMGGRLDSTNIIEPIVSVLTNVTVDHQAYLGNTVEKIGLEKIGVSRRGHTLVTAVDDDLFINTLGPALKRRGVFVSRLNHDFHFNWADTSGENAQLLDFKGPFSISGLELGLKGKFQGENAAVAMATVHELRCQGFTIKDEHIRSGLKSAHWPGRMEVLAKNPLLIVDGCHNPGAATKLAQTLEMMALPIPRVMIHGSKPDKNYGKVLEALAPHFDAIIETTIPGLADPSCVAAETNSLTGLHTLIAVEPDLQKALALAKDLAKDNGSILVTGSLYLVGAFLEHYRGKFE
ncbi:MAG TPA: folylpolyglutamate synthase/dihydrofolate synthase family protein [Myxococcota bacterium]|jgi:dihydrofolate synthase/folylpolyglutamate synthase|nr:folylpolyglutamate synthase/dihydrofolate synthase family protein [Myxococcota bacterium]HON24542.1 folylpolyglutamate synthase/dihydrofolate synthase family protein [Myxococcota bacterium]HOS61438.1 folylpolyglutamate synthase/dihydrofolate synthase family protein [Myxococcota bacterium]HPC91115.1 folylpolyglutamate synthase/dihydrofolate synthase family protein [Myxococcota bacterium]HPL24408.1 folylpolyglutamate synthase/dihydrofolate synthase family protein [Myxococcota bacterium]